MRLMMAFATLLALACRTAQPPVVAGGPLAATLEKANNELTQAILERNAAKVESFAAPEYKVHFIDHAGTAQPPTAPRPKLALEAFRKMDLIPLATAGIDLRVFRDIGVVTTYMKWQRSSDNGSGTEGYMTDVWIRRKGEWKLLYTTIDLLSPNLRGY